MQNLLQCFLFVFLGKIRKELYIGISCIQKKMELKITHKCDFGAFKLWERFNRLNRSVFV